MQGNVMEWVQDCIGDYKFAPVDGSGAPESKNCSRVVRGGAWFFGASALRLTQLAGWEPKFRAFIIGARLVRKLSKIS